MEGYKDCFVQPWNLGVKEEAAGHSIVLPRIRNMDVSCASIESEREGAVVLCEG